MEDDEIIKRRLLIDGDGAGDDRRLNMLLKDFLKWMHSKNETPESNQKIYDRLMSQLAQCKFDAAKNKRTRLMIEEERLNYEKISQAIDKSIEVATKEIEESKKELVVANQIRKNKMDYDKLAKLIKQQPDRKETQNKIKILQKELTEYNEKKLKLQRKFEKRQKDFTVLMYAVRELEAQLDKESSSEDEQSKIQEEEMVESKSDDEEIVVSNTTSTINLTQLEGLSDDDVEGGATAGKIQDCSFLERSTEETIEIKDEADLNGFKEPMYVDEDVVLELSIEQDEIDVKTD